MPSEQSKEPTGFRAHRGRLTWTRMEGLVLQASMDLGAESPLPHPVKSVLFVFPGASPRPPCTHWPQCLPPESPPDAPAPLTLPLSVHPPPPCQHGRLQILGPRCPLPGLTGGLVVWGRGRTLPTPTSPRGPSRQLHLGCPREGAPPWALPADNRGCPGQERSLRWGLLWLSVTVRLRLG